jgi:hypothetical protein
MKHITEAAIKAVNEQNQTQVVERALGIVRTILNLQEVIKESQANIASHRKELEAISNGIIDDHKVLGVKLPAEASRNENQKTIARVIETANKNKQDGLTCAATRLTEGVLSEQSVIDESNKKITELREELSKLSADVVTDKVVTG